MAPTVLLFDIDRTLIDNGGAGRRAMERGLEAYLSRLEQELDRARDEYVVYPGVRELCAALSALEGVALGLGTGNVERGARLKLAPGDLNRFFAFGGFGSDATERADVLRVGARRGADRLGLPVERCRVVVIGDTPRDVAAGLAIGARCVAVATGGYGVEELRASGAHHVFEGLDRSGVREALLGEG